MPQDRTCKTELTEVWPQHIILSGDGVTLWQNNHYLATLPSSFEASLNQEEEIIKNIIESQLRRDAKLLTAGWCCLFKTLLCV